MYKDLGMSSRIVEWPSYKYRVTLTICKRADVEPLLDSLHISLLPPSDDWKEDIQGHDECIPTDLIGGGCVVVDGVRDKGDERVSWVSVHVGYTHLLTMLVNMVTQNACAEHRGVGGEQRTWSVVSASLWYPLAALRLYVIALAKATEDHPKISYIDIGHGGGMSGGTLLSIVCCVRGEDTYQVFEHERRSMIYSPYQWYWVSSFASFDHTQSTWERSCWRSSPVAL